ncbi:MAG: hypothetical protein U0U69_01080 [Acidimicrobiia bacterium]
MAAPNVKIRGDGRVDLTWADVTVAVEGLGPQVTYRSNATAVTWRPRRLAREGDTTTATRGGLVLTLKGEARGDAVVLSAVVRNDRPDSVRLDALAPLASAPTAPSWSARESRTGLCTATGSSPGAEPAPCGGVIATTSRRSGSCR